MFEHERSNLAAFHCQEKTRVCGWSDSKRGRDGVSIEISTCEYWVAKIWYCHLLHLDKHAIVYVWMNIVLNVDAFFWMVSEARGWSVFGFSSHKYWQVERHLQGSIDGGVLIDGGQCTSWHRIRVQPQQGPILRSTWASWSVNFGPHSIRDLGKSLIQLVDPGLVVLERNMVKVWLGL